MNLKNYGGVEVQHDLDKLLVQVQKELKKKMFPRKHIKLLQKDIQIVLGELVLNFQGQYETIESEGHKHNFTHKIIINNWVFDEYRNGLYGLGFNKRYTKKRLKNTIAHEIIHAYVYEEYEWCGDEYKFHCDGSPIFLSILTYLNIPSGHKSMRAFEHSELYKRVKGYTSFEVLKRYLIHLTCEYEKRFKKLEQMFEGNKVYINTFSFSTGDITGLKGISTNTIMSNGCIGKDSTFTVGANVDIDRLKDLVLSKINRNVFESKEFMLRCGDIDDIRNRLKLQSMDI